MALDIRNTRRGQAGTPVAPPVPSGSSDEQRYFLDRLTRLGKKSALLSRYLVPTDRRMRLLNHALLTTYDDCRLLGVSTEAKAIIDEARRDSTVGAR